MASSSSIDSDMAGCSAAGRAPNQPESVCGVPKKLNRSLGFAVSPCGRVGRGGVGAQRLRGRSCMVGHRGGVLRGHLGGELAGLLLVIGRCETLRWCFCWAAGECKSFGLTSLKSTGFAVRRVCWNWNYASACSTPDSLPFTASTYFVCLFHRTGLVEMLAVAPATRLGSQCEEGTKLREPQPPVATPPRASEAMMLLQSCGLDGSTIETSWSKRIGCGRKLHKWKSYVQDIRWLACEHKRRISLGQSTHLGHGRVSGN